jgi:hypothetical protein
MVRLASFLVVACLLLLFPIKASAVGILPNPVVFTDGTTTFTVTLVGSTLGLPGGWTQLTGTTNPGDITLIFTLSVSAGAVEVLRVGARIISTLTLIPTTGTGTIAGSGVDVNAGAGGTTTTPRFDFGVVGTPVAGEGVGAGQTSDYFFLSFASLAANSTEAIRFTADPGVGGLFGGDAIIIPEPGSLLLFGMGLGFLGTHVARRRKS